MKNIKRTDVFWYSAVIAAICFIYRGWILHPEIIGGDWPYIFPGMIRSAALVPSSWNGGYGGGAGGISPAYFLSVYNQFTFWLSGAFHISWPLVYKVFWFFLPMLSVTAGGFVLVGQMFPKMRSSMRAMTPLIFASNTYMLMITSGGQMGVVLAASLTPWVYLAYGYYRTLFDDSGIHHTAREVMRRALLFGLVLGAQFALDPRIGYVNVVGLVVITLLSLSRITGIIRFFLWGSTAVITVVLVNAYWILPLLLLRLNPLQGLGSAFTTVGALKFFSFADFSHAISLLHPNWPENIFGKTYFLQSEFLVLPVIAFAGLLLRSGRKRTPDTVLQLAALGLTGAFFAKGAQAPFGGIYVWMFEHVPGFVMFRDPTKFYVLTTLAYGLLIPWTLDAVADRTEKRKLHVAPALAVLFVVFWFTTIRQAVAGQINGTFASRTVPAVYESWARRLTEDTQYWRTLWVPRQSRFTYTSELHPSIEAEPLLSATDAASITDVFNRPNTQERLAQFAIRYVVVGYDPYGELFVVDRTYSPEKRASIEQALDKVSWLRKVQEGELTVYETPGYRSHFWTDRENGSVQATMFSGDTYSISVVGTGGPGRLMFSENYSQGWQMVVDGVAVPAQEGPHHTMMFPIRQGSFTATVEFAPRHMYTAARYVTIAGLVVIAGFLMLQSPRRNKKRGQVT